MDISTNISPIKWNDDNNEIVWLDNSRIPSEEVYNSTKSIERLITAIKTLEIRGAPILGEAGAYGTAMIVNNSQNSKEDIIKNLSNFGNLLATARPTAVNLSWGVAQIKDMVENSLQEGLSPSEVKNLAITNAKRIQKENINSTIQIGKHGKKFIKDGDVLVTVCNAGTLACDGIGTATAPMRTAFAEGINFEVLVTYTAPLYQGARLTAWELHKDGIPIHVITDNMAGHLMREKKATSIFAGADRILCNTTNPDEVGTVYNKIGTFNLALIAKQLSTNSNEVKLHVAAPISTIDKVSKVSDVKIEERNPKEVEYLFNGTKITPDGVSVFNPAFDRTPPELVSSIITEKGVAEFPYTNSLTKLLD